MSNSTPSLRYLDVWVIGSWRWEDFDGTLSLLLQLGHILHSNKRWERKLKLRLIHLSPLSLEHAAASEGDGEEVEGAQVNRKRITQWYAAARKMLPELEASLRALLEETRIVAESVAVIVPETVLSAPSDEDDRRFARLSELYEAIAPGAPFPFPFVHTTKTATREESKNGGAEAIFANHEFDPAARAYPSDAWRVRKLLSNALQRSYGADGGASPKATTRDMSGVMATEAKGAKNEKASETKWSQWEALPRRVREAVTLNRVMRSFSGGGGGDSDSCESRTDCALLALPALPLREWTFGMEDNEHQSAESKREFIADHEERSRMFVDMLELLSSGMPPLGLVASGDRKAKIARDL